MAGWMDKEGILRTSQVPQLPPLTPSKHGLTGAIVPHKEMREENEHREGRGEQGRWVYNQELAKMERRLDALELSHQLFLEELVRMQTLSKSLAYKHLHDDRSIMEQSVRESYNASSSLVNRLEQRVLHNEQREADEINRLTRTVGELQAAIDQQQVEGVKQLVAKIEDGIKELVRQQGHLEAVVRKQGEMLLGGTNKMDELVRQHQEMSATMKGLSVAVHGLEGEHMSLTNSLGRVDGITEDVVTLDQQLCRMIDTKTGQLWAAISEIRNTLAEREMDKNQQDQWLKQSFSRLQENIQDLSTATLSTAEMSSVEMRAVQERGEEETKQLFEQVMNMMKQQREAWEKRRAESRTEVEQKLSRMEEAIHKRFDMRDKQLRDDSYTEQQKQMSREIQQAKHQVQQSMAALQKNVSHLESEGLFTKKEFTRVLTAEIKTRRQEILDVQAQCSEMQEILHSSIDSLRDSITLLENRVHLDSKQFQELTTMVDVLAREQNERLANMETTLSSFQDRLPEQDSIHRQLAEWQKNTTNQLQSLEVRLEASLETAEASPDLQPETGSNTQLETQVTENAAQLHNLAASLTELKTKLSGEVEKRTNQWCKDMLELRNELAALYIHMFAPQHPQTSNRLGATWPQSHSGAGFHQHSHIQHSPHPQSHYSPPPTHPGMTSALKQDNVALRPEQAAPFSDHTSPHLTEHTAAPISDQTATLPHHQDSHQQDNTTSHQQNTGTHSDHSISHTDNLAQYLYHASPTPEPHSGHSSPQNGYRPRRSRRGRVRHRQHVAIVATEPTETQGTFTSAAPTPLDMRRILLDQSHEQSGGEEKTNTETHNTQAIATNDLQSDQEQAEEEEEEAGEGEEEEEEKEEEEEEEEEGNDQANLIAGIGQHDSREEEEEEEEEEERKNKHSPRYFVTHQEQSKEELELTDEKEQDSSTAKEYAMTHLPPQQLLKRVSSRFIKSDDDDDEEEESTGPQSWMNEWGVYQALRLVQIKERLMRPVYRMRQQRGQQLGNQTEGQEFDEEKDEEEEEKKEEEEEEEVQWTPQYGDNESWEDDDNEENREVALECEDRNDNEHDMVVTGELEGSLLDEEYSNYEEEEKEEEEENNIQHEATDNHA